MRGPSENEWLQLGERACRIRDTIIDSCVSISSRFNVTDNIYKSVRALDAAFSMYRSSLDDFISGSYGLSQCTIGHEHVSITRVFYGPRENNVVEELPSFKKGKKPKTLTNVQERDMQTLWEDISTFLADVQTYPYLKNRFAEKSQRRVLNRLKGRLSLFKDALPPH